MKIDKQKAHNQAMAEIKADHYAKEVERQKRLILQKRSLWERLFPWTIQIKRRQQ